MLRSLRFIYIWHLFAKLGTTSFRIICLLLNLLKLLKFPHNSTIKSFCQSSFSLFLLFCLIFNWWEFHHHTLSSYLLMLLLLIHDSFFPSHFQNLSSLSLMPLLTLLFLLGYVNYECFIIKCIVESIIYILACFHQSLLFKDIFPLLFFLLFSWPTLLRTLRMCDRWRVKSRVESYIRSSTIKVKKFLCYFEDMS